jgi:putative ABC transport system permease protein
MTLPDDQKAAFQRDRTACLVGRPLAITHNLKVGDRVTLIGDIFPVTLDLTVRGVYDAPDNAEVFYFHWKYLEESVSPGRRSQIGTFSVLAESPEAVPRVARAIDQMFRNSPVATRTESEQQFALSFVSLLGNVKVFLLSVCAAVTFTVLLVSANTMAMSVRERVREVGILKTLGFTRGKILGIVLAEAGAISLAGGALGVVLAAGICTVIRNGPVPFDTVRRIGVDSSVAALSLGIAAAIGVISSFIPAWNAARTTIVEAIRHGG